MEIKLWVKIKIRVKCNVKLLRDYIKSSDPLTGEKSLKFMRIPWQDGAFVTQYININEMQTLNQMPDMLQSVSCSC